MLPGLVQAFTACVSTPLELAQALSDAQASADASIHINIRPGTYQSASVVPAHSGQSWFVSGGWDATCVSQVSHGRAAGTILVGDSSTAALFVTGGTTGQTGNIVRVNDLILRNPGFSNSFDGACLSGGSHGNDVRVARVVMDQCIANGTAGHVAYIDNNSGSFTLGNAVIAGNSSDSTPLEVSCHDNCSADLLQITLTNNALLGSTPPSRGINLSTYNNGAVNLVSSVAWNGDASVGSPDILTSGTGISLDHVDYQYQAGDSVTMATTFSLDPGFVSRANPRLRGDAILVDAGKYVLGPTGSYDADGAERVQGVGSPAAVDIGAFERNPDQLFGDDFGL